MHADALNYVAVLELAEHPQLPLLQVLPLLQSEGWRVFLYRDLELARLDTV